MVNVEKSVEAKITKLETQSENKVMDLAASWYIAMQSKELGKKPQAIQLFGRPLVAWRDKLGKPVIMERFCSHMGASLAIGQIIDGCIQCPFHHWRYDSSGVCVDIPKVATPTTDVIPSTARQHTYVTQEKYGYIWVWYGSVNPLFPLPKFDPAESDKHNYMSYRFFSKTKTTVLRVLENSFDHHHVVVTHNLPIINQIKQTLLNKEDIKISELSIAKEAWFGTVMEAQIKSYAGVGAIAKFLGLNVETWKTRLDAWPSGSLGTTSFNGQQKIRVLSGITPISENQTTWHLLFMIKKTGNLWLDLLSYIVFGWQNEVAVSADVVIWDTMSAKTGQAFIKPDQPVLKFRQFYQSWVDKAQ
uniref:FisB3 n=1 Tax=Fischerella sp. SAG 46.79 TaxID=1930929 RepID=A0A1P8VSM8_9CYAN|nr:FisB3 [Fischerella sp. SAG 46.79]AQY10100.1 NifO2 [Fischerella sp. SAG 46.79]